jgi:large subunit ribosomal protein L4
MPDAITLGGGSTVGLDAAAFGARFNGPLVHESVRAEQAARRQGTAATKTRGMVSGGGAKPWRQKGTGRARAGSSRSPVWTGGGVVFGPQPRHYTFKVNRKERRAALRSALSLHADRGSIAILDAAKFAAPRTSDANDLLLDWNAHRPTLVVVSADEANAGLSFRNIPRVAVLTPENVGVVDIVGSASLLVSHAALEELTARATSERAKGAKAAAASDEEPQAVAAPVAQEAAAEADEVQATTDSTDDETGEEQA